MDTIPYSKHHNVFKEISNSISAEVDPKILVRNTTTTQDVSTMKDTLSTFPTPLSKLKNLEESFNYSQSKNYTNGGNMNMDLENFEEARYNLATRIMSNGVEVIIAGDKSKPADKFIDSIHSSSSSYSDGSQIVPHQIRKPMTLAPSTLKNQMVLLVPSNLKEKFTIPMYTNQFVTKTCLTTYTYRTTYLEDGTTTVESREKVIANIATEERNYPKISSAISMGVTLSRTPQLAVGVFPTTYSYFYTLYNGESSKMLTSEHTVLNTITAPDDYISFLQPSEAATPIFDTNTYFSKVAISKTVDEGGVEKVLTNSETLTQVIVTESLPARSTSVLTSYYAFDVDETFSQTFPTSTETYLDNSYINEEASINSEYDMQIYATKTFITTFTYLSTATVFQDSKKQELKFPSSENGNILPMIKTSVNYHTRVIENVITEAIPTSLLNPELITKFRKALKKGKNQKSVVTLATLLSGQTMEITAMKIINSDTAFSLLDSSVDLSNANINTKGVLGSSSIKSTSLNKLPKKTAAEFLKPSRIRNSSTTSLAKDPYYESSELKPLVIKLSPEKDIKNSTKLNLEPENNSPSPTYLNNIFGSLNLNGLTVLRPVFNAMADLLQNRFVSSSNTTESKNVFKNIVSNTKNDVNHDNPIYIPVQDSPEYTNKKHVFEKTKGSEIAENSDFDIMRLKPPQSLHIQPPEADLTISEDNWMYGKYKSENNHAHISNKLQNSNQQPLINGGIPIRPGEIITANSDVIVGKPNGIQQPKVYTLQSNVIPLRRGNIAESSTAFALAKNVPYYEKNTPNPYKHTLLGSQNRYVTENYDNILKPPPPPQVLHSNKLRSRPQLLDNMASISPVGVSNFESIMIYPGDHGSNKKDFHENYQPKIYNLNNELKNNEIIEIKRMPQIFSTDLPPEAKVTQSSNVFFNNQFTNQVPQNQFQLRLSSHYRNSSSKLNSESNPNKLTYQNQRTSPFQESLTAMPFAKLRPHSNHHRINLQTNVLSHNIAINVPPLTFKKESELATPVLHGIPSNSGQLIMPHIKIPINEVEVQVNLTPQYSVSQHHQLINYPPNTGKVPAFGSFVVENGEAQPQISSKSKPHLDTVLYQNQHKVQLPSDKYTQIKAKINAPNQNMLKEITPSSVSNSYFTMKPTGFSTIDSAYNWNTEWSKEEIDSGSDFKTKDQIGAFSFSKNQLSTEKSRNQISNRSNFSSQVKKKKTSHPLISPLTVLQVNHLNDIPSQNTTSATPFNITQAIELQRKTVNNKWKELSDSIHKESLLYPKTKFELSSSTNSSKAHENWKISNYSNVNVNPYLELITPSRNVTTYKKAPIPLGLPGQPFTQNLLKPDISKKISAHSQRTHVYDNLFIANGEGFKLNDKSINTIKNASDRIRASSNLSNTISISMLKHPFYNDEQRLPGNPDNSEHTIFPTKIKHLYKSATANVELPIFEHTKNISNEITLTKTGIETGKHTNLTRNRVNAQTKNQNLKPVISSTKPFQSTTTSALPVQLPQPTQSPFQTTLPKNTYPTTQKLLYKTVVSIFTKPPVTTLVSSKSYFKSNFDDSFTSKTLPINDYIKTLKQSTPTRKVVMPASQSTKSSSFVTSSSIHFSSSFIHKENEIKHTTVLLPKLPQTSQSYSTNPHNSLQSRYPQITSNNFGQSIDLPTSISKETSDIILEPSTENFSPLFTSSNEVLQTSSINSTVPLDSFAIVEHIISSQQSNNSTLSLEQLVKLTKYITNTVTTTKTTISTKTIKNDREEVQNNFKTKTLHLTTTFTTTIVDTVTEIHTLIEPTRIIKSHDVSSTSEKTGDPEKHKPLSYLEKSSYSAGQSSNSLQVDQENGEVLEYNVIQKKTDSVQSLNEVQINEYHKSPYNTLSHIDKDNIFIVMTNRQGAANVQSTFGGIHMQLEDDYNDHINLDLATRDEDLFLGSEDRINNILLGGVLIATSTNSNLLSTQTLDVDSMRSVSTATKVLGEITKECRPACKTSRNELCKESGMRQQCVCRPGFARMFPDRPCKPTYTYTMQIAIKRFGDFQLAYNNSLNDNSSKDFRELAAITHDAIDRMVMQSDFRDVYHGVNIKSFSTDDTNHTLIANVLLQFSDMNDEKRLEEVFKKYLRVNAYNIGLTELFTDQNGVELINIFDFNECNHPNFHDCSSNARCFNLKGTYTCNCNDGFMDLSENSAFPGRLCAAGVTGCEKCSFHGQCVPASSSELKEGSIVCECFAWYSGSMCQLNLKILLIALMAFGTILFVILLICILLTCTKHRDPRKPYLGSVIAEVQSTRPAHSSLMGVRVNLKEANKAAGLLKNIKTDKRAMIMDTSSESSDCSLPYVLKDSIRSERNQYNKLSLNKKSEKSDFVRVIKEPSKHFPIKNLSKASNSNCYLDAGGKSVLPTFGHFQGTILTEIEQSDRSLTVMIPRAKYHPSVLPQAKLLHHQLTLERTNNAAVSQRSSETQTELDIGEKTDNLRGDNISTGALVSAGFEVSAMVNENALHSNNESLRTILITNENVSRNLCDFNASDDSMGNSRKSYQHDFSKICEQNVNKETECHILYNIYKSDESTDGQSFGDLNIPLAKCGKFDHDNRTINTNEEANTMAERDVGSTFLLPHTHLYKPEKESDVSGLDSV